MKKLSNKMLGLGIIGLSATGVFAQEAMPMQMSGSFGYGARSGEVSVLQNFLYEKGYLSATVRGYFGPATRQALIRFQSENGIRATGYFGPITKTSINNMMSMKNMNDNNSAGVMVGGAAMLPIRDIVDNAVLANNVTTVVAAVKAAGLVDTLKGAGPFTVFAPDNNAFDKLPSGTVTNLLKPEMKADLSGILTYHVVAGRYTAADIQNGLKLKTVNGKELTFMKDTSGNITINGSSKVLIKDVISSNGVTFIIDSVLLPQ